MAQEKDNTLNEHMVEELDLQAEGIKTGEIYAHGDGLGAAANMDPWANRSAKMKCQTCMWYAGKNDAIGRCRRNAPTMAGYPVVYALRDWCGQHKLDELFANL